MRVRLPGVEACEPLAYEEKEGLELTYRFGRFGG
jgi:hypothetical protein